MEGMKSKEFFKTPIEECYRMGLISIRAYNCCFYNDINTIGDLANYHYKKGLLNIRNCGQMVLKELEGLLDGIDIATVDLALKHQEQYESVPKEIKMFVENKPRQPYCESPEALYCFYCVNQNVLAERFCGLKSNDERRYYYQTLSQICSEIKNAKLTMSHDYELFVIAKTVLWFCNDQYSFEVVEANSSEKLRAKAITADFTDKISMLSTRTKKIQEEKIPTYLQAVSLFQLTRKQLESFLFPGRNMKKTSDEISTFIDGLKEVLLRYDSLDDYEIIKQDVCDRFSYLSEDQVAFVVDFKIKYGHYPMFYILWHLLSVTKDRSEIIFAMSTGMLDGCCKSLEEIGGHFDLTRERIRQLLIKTSHRLFKDEEWEKYHFTRVREITRDDETYLNVVNKEMVDISFENFAQICFRGFHFIIVREKGEIKRVYMPQVNHDICLK